MHIWFLVDPDCWDSIIKIKSGQETWAALKSKHEKDMPSTQMNLHQCFYSLSHDPAISVIPFTNQVLAIIHQLESIKYKHQVDEITDKLLIGLDPSFAPVHTNLALCNPKLSIREITAALKEFEENKTLHPAYSALNDSIKQESPLYTNNAGCHGSGGGGFKTKFDDFDWGNSKGCEGVCWHCGQSGHIAHNCIANMPADMKDHC
jgi:hypothetical protein